jgi:hypothetical protein
MPELGVPAMAHEDKTMRVDVKDSVIETLNINDKVVLAVKGTIKELEASRTYDEGDEKTTYPGQIILKVDSVKVTTPNEFANLAESDSEDED